MTGAQVSEDDLSLAERISKDPALLSAFLKTLTLKEQQELQHNWKFWGRPKQQWPEGKWFVWLVLAGRGFGKTRTGAETIKELVLGGRHELFIAAGPTARDVRQIMVEGDSGILSVFPRDLKPSYSITKSEIKFHNGAKCVCVSADEPDRFRGQQAEFVWCDELCSWRYDEAWDMLRLGTRLGKDPRILVTTTPRPTPLIKHLIASPDTHLTRGSSYENRGNLADTFFKTVIRDMEDTRLGLQEIYAEILEDGDGLWTHKVIDQFRVRDVPKGVELVRIVVAIDPAVTSAKTSDETGIITAALGSDGHCYILDDRSGRMVPQLWALQAIKAFKQHRADCIVVETNNGGEMIAATLRTIDSRVPIREVRASRGKTTRAEPVANLYERGVIHHVGMFPRLETQMCNYDPLKSRVTRPGVVSEDANSPDRMDALVWAVTHLMLLGQPYRNFSALPPA